jgi:hypothetical protein
MKQEKEHNMCKIKIQIRFYCKEEMKTEQGYDKKMYYKLTLNRLKLMKNFTSINLLIRHLDQGSFKNFQPRCDPCVPMYEL